MTSQTIPIQEQRNEDLFDPWWDSSLNTDVSQRWIEKNKKKQKKKHKKQDNLLIKISLNADQELSPTGAMVNELECDILWKQVRTPVVLLRSLSD